MLESTSIKIANFKPFGKNPQGFDNILPINIIVGKNNTGKSALLDLVQYCCEQFDISAGSHQGKKPEIHLTKLLTLEEIEKTFSKDRAGGVIPGGGNNFNYGSQWIGKPIEILLEYNKEGTRKHFIEIYPSFENENIVNKFAQRLADQVNNPLQEKIFLKIQADRDISKEPVDTNYKVESNGKGTTNIIQSFYNNNSLNRRDLIEGEFLKDLNEIFYPDSTFSRILVQRLEDTNWEIFLEEEKKGRISLSDSGSGLKTVILVLANVLLLPNLHHRTLKDYVFAFEELENNLHPSLQRRLFQYLGNKAKNRGCTFFITTHSNVIIDLFSKEEHAQIYHITHDGEKAACKKVETYLDNKDILSDLDIRASDLLQSNAIIWLEGPSDRIYFNKWIEIWTDGFLKEDIHYQCLFYGGRLLSHLAITDEEFQEKINILGINQNAIVLIDSDKKSRNTRVNDTKQRIKKEVEEYKGLAFITKRREIENYIPHSVIQKFYNNENLPELETYEDFKEYLQKNIDESASNRFERDKVSFAIEITKSLTKTELEKNKELSKFLNQAVEKIRKWNHIEQEK